MLIDGHYGLSGTFNSSHILDGGGGDPQGDGPYTKASAFPSPNSGTVYVVNGVGQNAVLQAGILDHPAMVTGLVIPGSTLIDVNGHFLDAYFISRDGDILDHFQIVKGTNFPTGGPVALMLLVTGLAAAGVMSQVPRRLAS
jgi:hypothetical protein